MTITDYIIVGGGSAGCVIAGKLLDAGRTVTVIESGPLDRNPMIHLPVGFFGITDGPLTWQHQTVEQRHLNNRKVTFPQAKVIGGGSSINAQVYTRGNRRDYDSWKNDFGCSGWSFDDVLPYFLDMEDNHSLGGALHGIGGQLGVSDIVSPHPLSRNFVQSCHNIGIPSTADFNGLHQVGASLYQTTTRNARRCSSATAFLRPHFDNKNLNLLVEATAQRILIEDGKAIGICYTQGGTLKECFARHEVIITAGSFHSPKLLMLSGIGPGHAINELGINLVFDSSEVGANLQDHFDVDIVYRLLSNSGLNRYDNPVRKVLAGFQYLLFKTGPVTSTIAEAGAFYSVAEDQDWPDTQFHFLPACGAETGVDPVPGGAGCTLNWYFLRPKSRGTVRLASADSNVMPLVDPCYLENEYDEEMTIKGFYLARKIMGAEPISNQCLGEHFPGKNVQSKDEVLAYIRENGRTSYHPVGTCRMGADGRSVVDLELRVRGIRNLRIADASVMPAIVSSNTNAATMMIASRAAEYILKY